MSEKRLSKDDFVLEAIRNLRKKQYKGIHAVYSSLNNAFREYFGEEPRGHLDQMRTEGKIEMRMVRGGPMIYLPGEAPDRAAEVSDVISKIEGAQDG